MRWSRCTWVQLLTAALVALVSLTGCGSVAPAGPAGTSTTTRATSTAVQSLPAVQLAPETATSGLPTVAVDQLPPEAVTVLLMLFNGSPFPYKQDGATFQNRERMLPAQPAGFYREYTVRKPGESDRGPWRVIAGADGSRFWTADHYASFEEVVQP